MEMETCAANYQGSEDEGEGDRRSVGDWWMEGGMGVIDVGEIAVVYSNHAVVHSNHAGETALVHSGKTPPSLYPSPHPSLHPSLHLSLHPSLHMNLHPSLHMSLHLSLHPSLHLSPHPSLSPRQKWRLGDRRALARQRTPQSFPGRVAMA